MKIFFFTPTPTTFGPKAVIGVVWGRGLVPSTIPMGVLWGVSTEKKPQRNSGLDQILVRGGHITGWAPNVVLDVLRRFPGCRGGFDTDFRPNQKVLVQGQGLVQSTNPLGVL